MNAIECFVWIVTKYTLIFLIDTNKDQEHLSLAEFAVQYDYLCNQQQVEEVNGNEDAYNNHDEHQQDGRIRLLNGTYMKRRHRNVIVRTSCPNC